MCLITNRPAREADNRIRFRRIIFMNIKFSIYSLIACMMLLMLPAMNIHAQTNTARYRIFRRDAPATLDDIAAAMRSADVVFIGEAHDDKIAHELELELLRRAALDQAAISDASKRRAVALSLEMFERDVQTTLDEYLAGLITENHFLLAARPWTNYQSDYRPLVEFARENRLPVIAANAPRRYVNRVSRLGSKSLAELSNAARAWLPPLPFASASPAYATKFTRLMSGMPTTQTQNATPAANAPPRHSSTLLEAQALWDATMAHSIAEHLKRTPAALVVHVNGKFHTEERLGTPEHLVRYRPGTSFLVITITPGGETINSNSPATRNAGDFVIITDAASQGAQ
jgi:uncharacterized iron-regulated protein